METMTVQIPDTDDLETEKVQPLVLRARELVVTDLASYNAADEFRKTCRSLKAWFTKEIFAAPKSSANDTHKAVCAAENKVVLPIETAEKMAGKKMMDWKAEEDRKALMERERLQKEANKKAEDERLAQAAALQAEGRNREAKAAISRPVVAPPVAFQSAAPAKIKGQRDNWKWEIIDETLVPRQYLGLDEKKITAHGKSMGKDASIPGIRFYNEPTIC